MNRQDHLLTILAEECSEVQKLCCKALRFGLEEFNIDQKESNKDALLREINDTIASIEMLLDDNINNIIDDESIINKMDKVERWLNYSADKGRLDV